MCALPPAGPTTTVNPSIVSSNAQTGEGNVAPSVGAVGAAGAVGAGGPAGGTAAPPQQPLAPQLAHMGSGYFMMPTPQVRRALPCLALQGPLLASRCLVLSRLPVCGPRCSYGSRRSARCHTPPVVAPPVPCAAAASLGPRQRTRAGQADPTARLTAPHPMPRTHMLQGMMMVPAGSGSGDYGAAMGAMMQQQQALMMQQPMMMPVGGMMQQMQQPTQQQPMMQPQFYGQHMMQPMQQPMMVPAGMPWGGMPSAGAAFPPTAPPQPEKASAAAESAPPPAPAVGVPLTKAVVG